MYRMPSRPPYCIATTKTLSRQYQAGLPLVTPPSGTGRLQKVKQHLSFNLNKADCLNITWTHESLCCSNKGFAQGTIDTLKNCEKEIEDKCSKAVTGWVPLWGNISPTCVCSCTTYFLCGKIYLQYVTVYITHVFKNIILIHNSGMQPSWLSWRPASRLLMTSRQVKIFPLFTAIKKIVPHFPLKKIWIEYK